MAVTIRYCSVKNTCHPLPVGRTWEVRALAHQTEAKLRDTNKEVSQHWQDLSAELRAFVSDFAHPPEGGLVQAQSQHAKGVAYHCCGFVQTALV